MTDKEIRRQAERDIKYPLETTLEDAYVMGADMIENQATEAYNDTLETIGEDLKSAIRCESLEDVEDVIENIQELLQKPFL